MFKNMYDIIVVGGGPAGLVAALYARRANKTVLVIERETFGGQITFSPKVDNIPGFSSVSGNEFAEKLVDQVLSEGADVELAQVLSVVGTAEGKLVKTDSGEFEAKAVILATGAKHRHLGVPGEEALIGNGVSFCAVCDGAFYKDREVAVVGGGNSALQEAILLSALCRKVTVLQNLDRLTGEGKLIEQIALHENIEVRTGCTVTAVLGDGEVTGVRIRSEKDHGETDLDVQGIFVAIGLAPDNGAFASVAALDAQGYFEADDSLTCKTEGIFVAGDCRKKAVRQVVTAAADGATAALAACNYIDRTYA